MQVMVGFGLGVLVGALAAFGSGRKYERAHQASVLAAGYVGAARELAGKAAGGVVLFAVVVLAGALVVWSGR
ncbi:hypothetical protein GCM10010435_44610 [Winogradskya consettensis]|uniref:Uncharacterized protein n=1 Tax=Winogradskya consettensis TaxID=113560 RepID=A0A919VWK5_9ACTN|nr:hypothetical protein [Actinoplanes consettensis]GIM82734.1 hypothetical protein Aco04nite_83000 [Actinoplanes consettensis]